MEDTESDKPIILDKTKEKYISPKNLKILHFQLDQRVSDIEKFISDHRDVMPSESLDEWEKSSAAAKGVSTPRENTQRKLITIKSIMLKHEAFYNDFNLRVSNLESTYRRLDPNNMRNIIKGIAEIVMQEKSMQMRSTVDILKSTHSKDIKSINELKNNLNEMDIV